MRLRITIDGNSYDVEVEVLDAAVSTSAVESVMPTPTAPASTPMAKQATAPPRPAAALASSSGAKAIKAPIAGSITQIKVAVGDSIDQNQVVLVMEAMKMETNIASPVAGRVVRIGCKPGDSVKPGQLLIDLE